MLKYGKIKLCLLISWIIIPSLTIHIDVLAQTNTGRASSIPVAHVATNGITGNNHSSSSSISTNRKYNSYAAISINKIISDSATMNNENAIQLSSGIVGANAPANAVTITAGIGHTCALTDKGSVMCWGRNNYGQLGNGSTSNSTTPVNVVNFTEPVISISAGNNYTCALTVDGVIKCWGENRTGQLGYDTATYYSTPKEVIGLGGKASKIATGSLHTCALLVSDTIKCWGGISWSRLLGSAETAVSLKPIEVANVGNGVQQIQASSYHTCVLGSNAELRCWGENHNGRLGDGTEISHPTPVRIQTFDDKILAMALGMWHSCSLMLLGEIKCWGRNSEGQLGDGTTINRLFPTNVVGLAELPSAVSVGNEHTCALIQNGGVMCWGGNQFGQLGDGTTKNRKLPVAVTELDQAVVGLTTGYSHTCAIMNDASIKCWGDNQYGQLGNGTTVNGVIPLDVLNFTKVYSNSGEPITQAEGPSNDAANLEVTTNLVLQLGFSDDHVLEAKMDGLNLLDYREASVNGEMFTTFFLTRNYEPRLLNDYATAVLVYKGKVDNLGNFVHRINIREPIDKNLLTLLPDSVTLSESLAFTHSVLDAYAATGFSFRAEKISTDENDTEYAAVLVYMEEPYTDDGFSYYDALTFERRSNQGEYEYLETFRFPRVPAVDHPFGNLEMDFTFDEAWSSAISDFTPESKMEKALFALGCNFSKEGFVPGTESVRGNEKEYAGNQFTAYFCTLLTDYSTNQSTSNSLDNNSVEQGLQVNNFVAIWKADITGSQLLWNSLYLDSSAVLVGWEDVNGDGVPDILIEKAVSTLAAGVNAVMDGGQELLQVTKSGDIVDLLTDVPSSIGEVTRFVDLDSDGITEIVGYSSHGVWAFGASRAETLKVSIDAIYKLEDDFYYKLSNEEFSYICEEEFLDLESRSGTESAFWQVFGAYTILFTCDNLGVGEYGWKKFKEVANPGLYDMKCKDWITFAYIEAATQFPEYSGSDAELPSAVENETNEAMNLWFTSMDCSRIK
jgi:alpha-tubulin suppressor-like RCC1 family protein